MKRSSLRWWLFAFACLLLLVNNVRRGIDLEDHIDLAPSYVAAHLMWSGESGAIYDNSAYGNSRSETWIDKEKNLMGGQGAETTFLYLPFYLVIVSPLLLLGSFQAFKIAIMILKIPALAWAFASMASRWPGTIRAGMVAVGIMSLSDAVYDGFRLGQNVEFLLFLLPFYFFSTLRSKTCISAALLCLAVLLKPWAVVLLGYPLASLKWKEASIQGSALGIMLLLQWLMFPEAMSEFAGLIASQGKLSILAYNNMSLDALIHKLSFPDWMKHFGWHPAPEHPGFLSALVRYLLVGGIAAYAVFTRIGRHRRLAVLMIPPVFMSIYWNHYLILYFPFFLEMVRYNRKNSLHLTLLIGLIVLALWADAHLVKLIVNTVLLRGVSLEQLRFILPFFHVLGVLLLLAKLLIAFKSDLSKERLRSLSEILGTLRVRPFT